MTPPIIIRTDPLEYLAAFAAVLFGVVILNTLNLPYDREFLETRDHARYKINAGFRGAWHLLAFTVWIIATDYYVTSITYNTDRYINQTGPPSDYAYDNITYNDLASNGTFVYAELTVFVLMEITLFIYKTWSHRKENYIASISTEPELSYAQEKSQEIMAANFLLNQRFRENIEPEFVRQATKDVNFSLRSLLGLPKDTKVNPSLTSLVQVPVDVADKVIETTTDVSRSIAGSTVNNAIGIGRSVQSATTRLLDNVTNMLSQSSDKYSKDQKIAREKAYVANLSVAATCAIIVLYIAHLCVQIAYENNAFRYDRSPPHEYEYILDQMAYRASMYSGSVFILVFLGALISHIAVSAEHDPALVPIYDDQYPIGSDQKLTDSLQVHSSMIATDANALTDDPSFGIADTVWNRIFKATRTKQTIGDYVITKTVPTGVVHDLIWGYRSGALWISPFGDIIVAAIISREFYYVNLLYLCPIQQIGFLVVVLGIAALFSAEMYDMRSFFEVFVHGMTLWYLAIWAPYAFQIGYFKEVASKYIFNSVINGVQYNYFPSNFYDQEYGCVADSTSALGVSFDLLLDQQGTLAALAIISAVMISAQLIVQVYTMAQMGMKSQMENNKDKVEDN